MNRISDFYSGYGSRLFDDEGRYNSDSLSSDATVFGRTLRSTKDVENPIFLSGSASQEQNLLFGSLCSFNIDALPTDIKTYHPMILSEGAASVSTNTSNTGEPQFNPLHDSLTFIEQTPVEQVGTELFSTLESRAEVIPEISQLPTDTESLSSNSRKKMRKRKGLRLINISKRQRMVNERQRQRLHRETVALNILKMKLGENYLPPEQDPMKLSRIKTLTGAIDYIRNLNELLAQNSPEHSDTSRESGNDN